MPKFLEMLGSDDSDFDRFGLGLVTSMVTSNVRGLKFEGAKEGPCLNDVYLKCRHSKGLPLGTSVRTRGGNKCPILRNNSIENGVGEDV